MHGIALEHPPITKTEKLESLISKLSHDSRITPPAQYFLTRLIHNLYINTLQWVTENGVPINNILFMAPSLSLWSDSFKYGIRG